MDKTNEIKVFYENFDVGFIIIHDMQRLGFRYTPKWLTNKNKFPLSVNLPLKEGEFEDNTITQWLTNLLPEGRQLKSLSRVLGVSASDIITFLQKIGGDTAGAISIGETERQECLGL